MASTAVAESVARWLLSLWRQPAHYHPLLMGYICGPAVVSLVLTYTTLFHNPAKTTRLDALLKVLPWGLRAAIGLLLLAYGIPADAVTQGLITFDSFWLFECWCRSCGWFGMVSEAEGHQTPGHILHPLEPKATTYITPVTATLALACSSSSACDSNTSIVQMRTSPPNPTDLNAARLRRQVNVPLLAYIPLEPSPFTAGLPMLAGNGSEDSECESVDMLCPWLQWGLILNLRTGRTIKMGGSHFRKLVSKGYTPDWVRGMLMPPV